MPAKCKASKKKFDSEISRERMTKKEGPVGVCVCVCVYVPRAYVSVPATATTRKSLKVSATCVQSLHTTTATAATTRQQVDRLCMFS